jgi:hypothetical protein
MLLPLCSGGALCDAKLNRTVVECIIEKRRTICRGTDQRAKPGFRHPKPAVPDRRNSGLGHLGQAKPSFTGVVLMPMRVSALRMALFDSGSLGS